MKNFRIPIVIGFGALIVIGVLLIFSPSFTPARTPPATSRPATAADLPADAIPYPNMERVKVGDARAVYETKQAVFVDVRDSDSYARGHIPGAKSMPLDVLEERMGELNKQQWIITYCT